MPSLLFDGDYTQAQIAGAPEYEIPFAADPQPYLYKVKYWQFQSNFTDLALGEPGPFGGYYVGGSPGSIKSVSGGVIEFIREFALVPNTRNEYESFVYSYQIVLVGEQGGITDMPVTVQSRVQFDYFQTSDPSSIDLPKAPRAFQLLNVIYPLNGLRDLLLPFPGAATGTEILGQDATSKIWKPGIYQRQQRFISWISIEDLLASGFA